MKRQAKVKRSVAKIPKTIVIPLTVRREKQKEFEGHLEE